MGHQKQHPPGSVVVDPRDPLRAGRALARDLFLPAMKTIGDGLNADQELLLWASALAAITGAMSLAIGNEATDVVLENNRTLMQKSAADKTKGTGH